MNFRINRLRVEQFRRFRQPFELGGLDAGLNIVAAPTDAEAKRLATSQQMSFADIFRGARNLTRPPIDDIPSHSAPNSSAPFVRSGSVNEAIG